MANSVRPNGWRSTFRPRQPVLPVPIGIAEFQATTRDTQHCAPGDIGKDVETPNVLD